MALFTGRDTVCVRPGYGAGAARIRGIWLEPEMSLWPGSSFNFSVLIVCYITFFDIFSTVKNKLVQELLVLI